MNNSSKIVIGLLAGFAAGAITGILLAPKKGAVTRRYLVKKGEAYSDNIKDRFNHLVDEINDTIDRIKDEVDDFTKKSKKNTKETLEDIKSHVKVS